jgi:hypothetical protein
MKFWKRLMFPPNREDFYIDRVTLKADLPWEPWLHCGVWLSVVVTIILGEWHLYPPEDFSDWVWLSFGLVSPPIGFASVWMLEHYSGKLRYIALWLRMSSDVGLSVAITAYLCNRVGTGQFGAQSIMADIILASCAWFTMTLVVRDIRFIVATEKLAALIYKDLRELSISEWVEQVDDASR